MTTWSCVINGSSSAGDPDADRSVEEEIAEGIRAFLTQLQTELHEEYPRPDNATPSDPFPVQVLSASFTGSKLGLQVIVGDNGAVK